MNYAERIRVAACGCRYDVVTLVLTEQCAKHAGRRKMVERGAALAAMLWVLLAAGTRGCF